MDDEARLERLERWTAWKADPEAFEQMLSEIASGESLYRWALNNGFAPMTVYDFVDAEPGRAVKYARARELQGEARFAEIFDVASETVERTQGGSYDSGMVADKRLRVDTLKWAASKLAPKRFGDKLSIGGSDDMPPVQHNVNLTAADSYKIIIKGQG